MKKLYFAALLLNIPTLLYAQNFSHLVTYLVGNSTFPSALAMGDMNGDSYLDIVTSNAGPNQPAVLTNRKDGTFGVANLFDANAHSTLEDVAVGDVTKDGYAEAVVLDFGGTLSLMYNQSRGGLSKSVQYTVTDRAVAVKLGDVNNDGYPDAVTVSLGNSSSNAGVIDVLLNTKRNTFGSAAPYSLNAGTSPYDVDLGDVDGDGYLDIVTALYESSVGVLLNKKDGTFTPLVAYTTGSSTHPENVHLNDINKDGYLDIITTDRTRGTVEVLLNNTDGTFGLASNYAIGNMSRPEGFAVGDVDGDGYADIVMANIGTNTIGILLNQKNGTFGSVMFLPTGSNSQPTDVVLNDVNKDGKLDIVFTNYTGTVGIFLNASVLATQAGTVFSKVQTSVYPNPITSQVSILTATHLPAEVRNLQIRLLNAAGQPVCRLTLPTIQGVAQTELPTTGLAPGLYLLQVSACDARGVTMGELANQRVSVD
jgi:hypothetical protein